MHKIFTHLYSVSEDFLDGSVDPKERNDFSDKQPLLLY